MSYDAGPTKVDLLHQENTRLRSQLAEREAEVERLREDYGTLLTASPADQYEALVEYLNSHDEGKRTIEAARAWLASSRADRAFKGADHHEKRAMVEALRNLLPAGAVLTAWVDEESAAYRGWVQRVAEARAALAKEDGEG